MPSCLAASATTASLSCSGESRSAAIAPPTAKRATVAAVAPASLIFVRCISLLLWEWVDASQLNSAV
jgi:hypothetical protein